MNTTPWKLADWRAHVTASPLPDEAKTALLNIIGRMQEIDSDISRSLYPGAIARREADDRSPTGDDYNLLWDAIMDEIAAASAADAPVKRSMTVDAAVPNVRKLLDCSTGHLDPASRAWMEAHESNREGTKCIAFAYGWLCYVREPLDSDEEPEETPAVLWAIFAHARTLDCEYVLFDADAPPVPGLPSFDW